LLSTISKYPLDGMDVDPGDASTETKLSVLLMIVVGESAAMVEFTFPEKEVR